MRSTVVLCILVAAADPSWAQERCGVAKDLIVQSLENLKTSAAPADVADGVQLLKQAALACPTLGDAWYYRSLFEDKLGHKPLAAFALRQAKLLGSTAMDSGINPFLLAAPPEVNPAISPVRQKWALVVGIGKFHSPRIKSLDFAKKDAEDLDALLEDPHLGRFDHSNVQVLTDKEATLVNVKAKLNWLAGHAGPSDLVVVFIASHGTGREKDPVGQLNYVLVNDTDDSDDDKLFGSSLPMVEISDIIRSRIQARRTVILLDTCHSEGSTKGLLRPATASATMLDVMKAGFGRAIIASSQQNQLSYESNSLENGLFTHFLVEGLKQQDGKQPLSKVFAYLQAHVQTESKAEGDPEQTPVLVRSQQGDEIVIGVEPAKTVAQTPFILPPNGPARRLLSSR